MQFNNKSNGKMTHLHEHITMLQLHKKAKLLVHVFRANFIIHQVLDFHLNLYDTSYWFHETLTTYFCEADKCYSMTYKRSSESSSNRTFLIPLYLLCMNLYHIILFQRI